MGAYVYDPFIRELLTIAIGDFKVQNTLAQVQFWTMLNNQMLQNGYERPEFRGFMADNAGPNWLAIRTVYNGGPKNKMENRERSCIFHWEKSMVDHTKRCIKPQFQEEHKALCRRWRDSTTESMATEWKAKVIDFWTPMHVKDGELPALQTWLAFFEIRASQWGAVFLTEHENVGFVPTVNLSESKHSSMRASQGAQKYCSLYEATASDLAMSALQSAHYFAYMSGRHVGTGPDLDILRNRILIGCSGKVEQNKVVHLIESILEEAGLSTPEMSVTMTESMTMRRKRGTGLPIEENGLDTHRPEYVSNDSKQSPW